jgi:hypothetical protein
MPLSLLQIFDQFTNTTLKTRCEAAMLKHAPSIASESRATPYHPERRTLALRIIQSGPSWGEWQRWILSDSAIINAANPAAVDALSDDAIVSLVLTVWNYVAVPGVLPADVA